MKIYEDEWAFWDDIVGRYILKYASTDPNTDNIVEAAGYYADSAIIERRKRRRVKGAPAASVSAQVSSGVTAGISVG
ncbi:hypothetical protein GIW70_16420 [Pseudomonas syringae]|nr:hypothetical protein [Pseudomonas syringae]MCF5069775.1 hypothetical protein [Pseudomonas syringae]